MTAGWGTRTGRLFAGEHGRPYATLTTHDLPKAPPPAPPAPRAPGTLFLPPRPTATGRALAAAAGRRGFGVETLTERRVPEGSRGLPGAALFAEVLLWSSCPRAEVPAADVPFLRG
ncbi:hypothetical protein ACFWPV_25295 [Streptomyces uncialis]|uniref:hypothetical protein n=1 Tax=Streptomyces uncialis TaxID=1048205 RepID=UPI0036468FD5